MIKKYFIQICILKLLLVNKIFLKYAYFDFKLSCVDDFPKYIISSERIFYPENQNEVCYGIRKDKNHIYKFEKIKQNLEQKI